MHPKSHVYFREDELNVFLAFLTSEAALKQVGGLREELLTHLEWTLEKIAAPVRIEPRLLKGGIPTIWITRLDARQTNYNEDARPVANDLGSMVAELIKQGVILTK